MKIWKHSCQDAILLTISVAQFIVMIFLAIHWQEFSFFSKLISFILTTLMITYNIIVISHLFTHAAWFESQFLNSLVSLLNTINIGQSVQAYQLKHVRNHHRYNNDQKGSLGKTNDTSSTFQDGKDNEHASLFRYAFIGGALSLLHVLKELFSVARLWRLTPYEHDFQQLLARSATKRLQELKQLRLDHVAHFLGMILFFFLSWQWTLLCYLPAFYLALSLVNIQNYYEHYGAMPGNKMANSVSYYGKLYNLIAFNDGYHQEHHLCPAMHWRQMPAVRSTYRLELDAEARIISPVPAILGFIDRKRVLLHQR